MTVDEVHECLFTEEEGDIETRRRASAGYPSPTTSFSLHQRSLSNSQHISLSPFSLSWSENSECIEGLRHWRMLREVTDSN